MSQGGTRIGLNAIALIASRVAGMGFTLIQSALIFRALGVEGTGQFGFAQGFASLFSVLAVLGLQRLLVRDISREPEIAWTYAWSAFMVIGALSTFVMILLAGITHWMGEEPEVVAAVAAAGASVVALWAVQRPFEALLMARERMGLVSLVYIAQTVLKFISVLAFLFVEWDADLTTAGTPYGAAYCHGAIALGNLLAFVLCVVVTIKVLGWHKPRFDFAFIIPRMRECFPYTLSMTFSLIYFKSDMALLQFIEGDWATGVYTPAQRVIEPVMMVAGLWGTAIFPALCRLSHTSAEHYEQLKATSARLALMGAFPMAAGLGILARPIVVLLTGDAETYSTTILLLQWLSAMVPLFYINTVGQEFLYAAHRNWYVTFAYGMAAIFSVLGNVIFIPIYGVMAVAWVALATNGLVSALMIYGLHQELGGMRLPTLLSKVGLACAAMTLAALWLAQWNLFVGVVAGAVVYTVVVFALRTMNDLEMAIIRHALGPLRGYLPGGGTR